MRSLAPIVLLACLAQLPGGYSGPFNSCFGLGKKSSTGKRSEGYESEEQAIECKRQEQEYLSGLEPLVSAAEEAYKDLVLPRRDFTDDELMKKLRVFKELADYDKLKKGPEFNLPNPKSPDSKQSEFGVPLAELLDYADLSALDCSFVAKLEPLIHENRLQLSPALLRFLERTKKELSALCGEESQSGGIIDPDSRRQLLLKARSAADETREAPVGAASQRLPTSLEPEHYDLFIWSRIREPLFDFDGSVAIRLRCRSATRSITLHAHHIAIDPNTIELFELDHEDRNAKLGAASEPIRRSAPTAIVSSKEEGEAPEEQAKPQRQLKVKRLSEDPRLQFSIVELDEYLEPSRDYLLRLNFVGLLNEDPVGFYRMKYQRYDSAEPTTQDGLWITDTFVKTPRMSTYLVAWAVTDFESYSEGKISVWVRPGLGHTAAEYALQNAGHILPYYEDIFGIPYPLPKLDMIALPKVKEPAMGNWGLITFMEGAIIYREPIPTLHNKQLVTKFVAYELAHQWFGNLVTMKWWNDLWLNEGFAQYMQYIGMDHVAPKWRMPELMVFEETHKALRRDSLSSTHQISVPVHNPNKIEEIFSSISFAKGASILRMMSYFLGEDVLRLGFRRYLSALMYKNAEQSDLWAHLTEAQRMMQADVVDEEEGGEPVDVERVMSSWTLQPGYPLVTLIRNYRRAAPAVGRLEQRLYQSDNLNAPDSPARWEIPITFTWESEQDWDPVTRIWLRQNESSRPLELSHSLVPPKSNEWVLVNVQQVGYYRVNYDHRNWCLLFQQLRLDHTQIPPINRAQLLDDLFELAKSSQLGYDLAMEATKYLKSERDHMPWKSVLLSLSYIDQMLLLFPLYDIWQNYVARLIRPFYRRYKDYDWTQDSGVAPANSNGERRQVLEPNDVSELYNFEKAITWACKLNIPHCVGQAKSAFAEWRASGKNRIKLELRLSAYCTAIEHGSPDDWHFLWQKYVFEKNPRARKIMMRGLACTKDHDLLITYLQSILDKGIRRADGPFVFGVVAKSSGGRAIAFYFMRDIWPFIKEFYRKDPSMLNRIIDSVADSMSTGYELEHFRGFYESVKGDLGPGKRSFESYINEIEKKAQWRERNYHVLEDWLLLQQPPPRAPHE